MGAKTEISWTNSTWNPLRGCSRISPGCGGANHQGGCYAEKIAARFSEQGEPFHGYAIKTPSGGQWTGKVELIPHLLDQPHRWKKPRKIFANSMSDLFHENLPDSIIDKIYDEMDYCFWHIFQTLTKRSDRQQAYLNNRYGGNGVPPHIWTGVSVEDKARRYRIDHLRETRAAVRFLSCEPLLEDLGEIDLTGIHQVICGGESGHRRRPTDTDWHRSLRDQCKDSGVAFYEKQIDKKLPIPADLMIREYPAAR